MKYIDADKLRSVLQNTINSMKEKDVKGERYDAFLNGKLSICEELLGCIASLQQEQNIKEQERKKRYQDARMEYWSCVLKTIDSKRILPTFKGQLLHDFKNELHTMKQVVGLINHPEIPEGLFNKLALVFATWGGYHFHPEETEIEDSLQQEQPEVDLEKLKNKAELIANEIMMGVQANKYHTCIYNKASNDFNHSHLFSAALKGIKVGLNARKEE